MLQEILSSIAFVLVIEAADDFISSGQMELRKRWKKVLIEA